MRPTDLAALLERIPECRTIVATGQKAAETLQQLTGCTELSVGGFAETEYAGRRLKIWRMPSSSRAIRALSSGKQNIIAKSFRRMESYRFPARER